MPRNGSGIYSKPTNTTAVPNTTIESAKFNALADDLAQDANTPRPIGAGGTGAANEAAARQNLGLGNVDNTSDLAKPISTAQQAALNTKANIAGQTFSGAVTVPYLNVLASSATEGGQVDLAPPIGSTTLSSTGMDIVPDAFRVFASRSGNLKGFIYDFANQPNGLHQLITSATIGQQSVSNAGTLAGSSPSTAANAASIAQRDSAGDLTARLFRTTYPSDAGTRTHFLGMNATGAGADNFARPTPVAEVRASLGVYTTAQVDANFMAKAGGTFSGDVQVVKNQPSLELRNTSASIIYMDFAQTTLGGGHSDYSWRVSIAADGSNFSINHIGGGGITLFSGGEINTTQLGDLNNRINGQAGLFADDRISQLRVRIANPGNLDSIIIARSNTSGTTPVVQMGSDIAGSSLYNANTGAALNYPGTWRSLGVITNNNNVYSMLFYRYA